MLLVGTGGGGGKCPSGPLPRRCAVLWCPAGAVALAMSHRVGVRLQGYGMYPPPPLVPTPACPNTATPCSCTFGPSLEPSFLRFQFNGEGGLWRCAGLQEGSMWVAKCWCGCDAMCSCVLGCVLGC